VDLVRKLLTLLGIHKDSRTQQGAPPRRAADPDRDRITWSDSSPTRSRRTRTPPARVATNSARNTRTARKPSRAGAVGEIEWPRAGVGQLDLSSLIGAEDAFEHTKLEAGEKVAYCTYDKVAYHLSTWKFLQEKNRGRCCSCGRSGTIQIVELPGAPVVEAPPRAPVETRWLRETKEVIGLKEIYDHVDRAVVVEGYVHEVYQSRIGTYFVRFERRKWRDRPFDGFKVVIFDRYSTEWLAVGLRPEMYEGHKVRVRGVIQDHEKWGIEILVNSPRVIQIIDRSHGG
jgi:hypothetical protein